jgi:YbbR domain-containing protein
MRRVTNERFLYVFLSILIATVAWLYVATAQNPLVERTMNVDVHVRGLSADEVVVQAPARVQVRLQGPRSALALLAPSLLDASVDLTGLRPGEHRVPIFVAAPPEVRTVERTPPDALVVLDTLSRKRMPVEVTLIGTPMEGITLGASRVQPAFVTISGASTQVEEVRHALVTLDVTAARQQVIASVPVRLLDANGQDVRGLSVSPSIIEATLPVRTGVITKVVPVVPTVVGSPPQGLTVTGVTISPATITLTGPGTALQNVEVAATSPVDLSGARGDLTRQVAITLPNGIADSSRRATVTVHIGRPLLSTVLHAVPVRVIGVPARTVARAVPARVEVQIEAPEDILQRLSPSAVRVEAQAAGQKPGQHVVALRVVLPPGVRLLSIRPGDVLVILTSS